LDRLCIPNYSAVLPGTEDTIWVYAGKGTTEFDAKASALMEAVERYSAMASNYSESLIRGTYSQLSKSYPTILHPAEVVEPVNPRYEDEKDEVCFLRGVDLLANEPILVPADIALYKYSPAPPAVSIFSHSHTNGLASGNVLEEAICHALCEVIERDAASIADLCASSIPYTILDRMNDLFTRGRYADLHIERLPDDKFVDDSSIFPDVDVSEIPDEYGSIKYLLGKFVDAGIPLLVKDITQSDIGITTFVASSIEWVSNDYGLLAKGYGAHPDSGTALIRAITEMSQTRAANIQGARDDLKRIVYKGNDEIHKRKWQFMPNLTSSRSPTKRKNRIKFAEAKTCVNSSIIDDIEHILVGLRKARLGRAILVNLTNSELGIPVVRAIVPGLETFAVIQSVMGDRARDFFWNLGSVEEKKIQ
jgi:ribosomal protein S12 methylthiotransferase accessory factor